jgi:hypothetical protein
MAWCLDVLVRMSALGVQRRNFSFLEPCVTGQTEFIVIRYSATNNGLPFQNWFYFNAFKVIRMWESICNVLARNYVYYCASESNQSGDFDVLPRFEIPWARRSGFWYSGCLSACMWTSLAPERSDGFYSYSIWGFAISRCLVNMGIPIPKIGSLQLSPKRIAIFSKTAVTNLINFHRSINATILNGGA